MSAAEGIEHASGPPAESVSPEVRALAEAAARSAGETAPLERGDWIHLGSSSLVLLLGEVAVRVGRNEAAGKRILRAQRLVDSLESLPFDLPRSVASPLAESGRVAVATERIHGQPHPSGSGDPAPLRELLDAVVSIDVSRAADHLAHPRDFLGGDGWSERLRTEVVELFPVRWRAHARRRAEALIALEQSPGRTGAFRHGDLAGSNVLWRGGRVAGVLDWDLAALDDPAEDAAALLWWHDWRLLGQVVDPETAARAEIIRASFPIQSVAFAHLHSATPDALAAAIERSTGVLAREAGAS